MALVYDDERVIRPNIEHDWTRTMINEYTKCAKSSTYFALNHAVAIHPIKGIIPLDVRDYQLRLLDAMDNHKRVLTVFPRQAGKSLTASIYVLHVALYSDKPVNIFLLAHKGDMSKQLLNDIKVIYEELPPYLKKGVKKYDATTIEFEDGSKIRSGTTTPDTIRGQSITFLLLDEFAFVPPHIVDDFYTAAQPTLSTGGRCCIISTPNGASGLFYDLYKGAKSDEGNGFHLVDMEWDEVPDRNEEFKARTIKEVGLVRWKQEYEMSFLGSSNTLVAGSHLERMGNNMIEPTAEYDGGNFRVWHKPKPNRLYLLSADVAKGVGKDFSTIQVIDVTVKGKYKQVAVFRDNFIRPEQFTEKINEIGRLYNDAYIIVENNTFGHQICIDLWETFEYENLYRAYGAKEHGVTANVRSKAQSTSYMKMFLEEDYLKVYDKETYKELQGFVETKPNIYACEGKKAHDDLVMALVWACYFINTQYWKDLEEYERNKLGLRSEEAVETSQTNKEYNINEYEREEFKPVDFSDIDVSEEFGW